MRHILSLLTVAAMMALMVVVMAAGPAFAAAQGDFFTGVVHAEQNSDMKADEGLGTAFMHNRQP